MLDSKWFYPFRTGHVKIQFWACCPIMFSDWSHRLFMQVHWLVVVSWALILGLETIQLLGIHAQELLRVCGRQWCCRGRTRPQWGCLRCGLGGFIFTFLQFETTDWSFRSLNTPWLQKVARFSKTCTARNSNDQDHACIFWSGWLLWDYCVPVVKAHTFAGIHDLVVCPAAGSSTTTCSLSEGCQLQQPRSQYTWCLRMKYLVIFASR